MIGKIGLLIWVAVTGPLSLGASAGDYELRGKILLPGGDPIKEVVPVVILEGATAPFSSRSLVLPSGEFKIDDLEVGTYRLTILAPNWGHMTVSIDIGPGTADEKGRVNREFEFIPRKDSDGGGTVSANQLGLPEEAWIGLRKAESKLAKRDTKGAIRELQGLVEKYPHFPSAWNRLGTIAYLTGRYFDAEQYFTRALEDSPELYAPLVNIAAVYLELGKVDLALATNLRCVQLRPDDPLAWSQLGRTQFVLGRFDESLESLGKAREFDAGHSSSPQLVMAKIYMMRKQSQKAVTLLEEFLQLHPDFPQADEIRQVIDQVQAEIPR
jgi:cytochrome c-type biogenesis protein CcmH/NrfG